VVGLNYEADYFLSFFRFAPRLRCDASSAGTKNLTTGILLYCSTYDMQSSNKVDTSTEPPSPVDAQRSKILASVPKESLGCFFVTPSEKPKHARAKFDPRRRDEVALVRRKGACLRCRLLKKKVKFYLCLNSSLPNLLIVV